MGRPVPDPEVCIYPRATLIAAACCLLAILASSAQAAQPHSYGKHAERQNDSRKVPILNQHIDFCLGQEVEAADVKSFARKTWRLKAWERGKPPRRVIEAHWQHVRCAKSPAHRKAIRRFWVKRRAAYNAHRREKLAERAEQRRLDALTPYGGWAIPEAIVMCESGGDFRAYNAGYEPHGPGSGPGGAYQIIAQTWAGYGGLEFAPTAASASPEAQHIVAGRIWGDVGSSAWACA